ncbi:MAG TPA: AAA family ATPase [Ktedonobacterales bacterium]
MTPTLQIRLLGTFSLVYAGEQVTGINTPRPQSLLAYLLLHRDAPQPRQQVAFLFWPDSTDAQARNNLRQTLHALRLALPDADAFLSADTSTLRWRPDAPFRLDVAEFERALERAGNAEVRVDPAALRAALEEAVSVYQADLLSSCYDDWIAPLRERLRQRYLDALDRLIRLAEAQHDESAAIGYAQRLAAHDPLSEDACRRLMRLLAARGDRAGALRAYHACAGALERQLGIAPGPETMQAYERLLRTEAASVPSGERSHVINASATLIGRQRTWERLYEAWHRAAAGEPGFVLLTGEAGIGKSRLAEELLLWAGQHGAVTARTRCYAAEGRLSLAPVTDWLRGEGLRPHLGRLDRVWLTEVSRILPDVASERPDLSPYEPISEYGQRQRFFEALARAMFAAPQPLLLLIDDLQWCDQETLEWLHFLLRFDPSARLLIAGTARTEETTPEHPLRALLLSLERTIGVTELALQPLDAAESAKLAATIAGHVLTDAEAMHLYHETEGNPLFVVETMRAGFGDPPTAHSTTDDGAEIAPSADSPSLPPRVRAVLAARLAQLSPAARDLAALAAAIGREFRLDVLVSAGTAEEDAVLRAMEELWRRRIVREQGANAYDFTHDKLREVAYAETSAPQRRLLHRHIAQALETIHAGDLDLVSGQIASHYDRAGQAERAIPHYQRAAEVARRVYANDDAIGLLVRALALIEHLPAGAARDAQELRLLLVLAPIYRITRGWTAPELEQVTQRTLVLCDAVGDDIQRAEALYGWESLLVVQARLEDVLTVAEELRALHEGAQRAAPSLSDMMAAGTHLHLGRASEANDMFERMIGPHDPTQSLDQLDSIGWNVAVHTRAWQAHALWCLGYPERALARGREAIQLARDLVLPFNQALASAYFAIVQQLRADVATAKVCAEEAVELGLEYRAPYYHAWAAILLRYAETWEHPDTPRLTRLREAIEEFKVPGARLRLPYYLWLLATVCRKAGRIEQAMAVLDEAFAAAEASNERWWDAELHRLRGELMEARGGHPREVEVALLQAAAIARAQHARSLELRAAMSLARWWCGQGRADDARRRLSEIYGWFTEGFDTPDLSAARALLAELA